MIVTISGAEGSGKSTLARRLAEELNLPRIYVGGIRREMAKERGETLAEFNKYGETHPETDVDVDNKAVAEARKLGSVIVEGRVMPHLIPESIKIFVDVDWDEAAKRIFNDPQKKQRNEDDGMHSVEEVKKSIKKRRASDKKRYKKYYNIDVFDKGAYDLIIDTTDLTPDQTFQLALAHIRAKEVK